MNVDLEEINDIKIPTGLLSSESVVFIFGCLVGEIVSSIINRYNCWVIGYEPYIKTFEENLKPLSMIYPNFVCINEAVWSETCTKTFYNYIRKWNNKINHPFGANGLIERNDKSSGMDDFGNEMGIERLEVKCRGINECFEYEDRIDLAFFDIEMSEFEVLPAMTDESLRKIKCMYVEFHNFIMNACGNKYSESDLDSILARLSKNGFSYIKINGHPDYLFYREQL